MSPTTVPVHGPSSTATSKKWRSEADSETDSLADSVADSSPSTRTKLYGNKQEVEE